MKSPAAQLYTLVINNLQNEDHGTYTCKVGDKSDDVVLYIQVDIEKPEPEYSVTTGKKGVIPVNVYGYPRPIIKWQKKVEGSYKTLVKLSNSRLSGPEAETGRMKIDSVTGHLIIENVMESDTGDYRIYVEGEDFFLKKSTRVVAKDINECLTGEHNCGGNATCTNTPGSFTCKCNTGFTGNGVSCEDLDECNYGNNCGSNSICTNRVGSYTCSCANGFTGNGTTCTDVDECLSDSQNDCAESADCINEEGSYSCQCQEGFTGNGRTCSDVDECSDGSHNCAPNADCTNSDGSYDCRCQIGFTGNGTICSDINECYYGNQCGTNSICINSVGSYTCICESGFTGNGITCTALPVTEASTTMKPTTTVATEPSTSAETTKTMTDKMTKETEMLTEESTQQAITEDAKVTSKPATTDIVDVTTETMMEKSTEEPTEPASTENVAITSKPVSVDKAEVTTGAVVKTTEDPARPATTEKADVTPLPATTGTDKVTTKTPPLPATTEKADVTTKMVVDESPKIPPLVGTTEMASVTAKAIEDESTVMPPLPSTTEMANVTTNVIVDKSTLLATTEKAGVTTKMAVDESTKMPHLLATTKQTEVTTNLLVDKSTKMPPLIASTEKVAVTAQMQVGKSTDMPPLSAATEEPVATTQMMVDKSTEMPPGPATTGKTEDTVKPVTTGMDEVTTRMVMDKSTEKPTQSLVTEEAMATSTEASEVTTGKIINKSTEESTQQSTTQEMTFTTRMVVKTMEPTVEVGPRRKLTGKPPGPIKENGPVTKKTTARILTTQATTDKITTVIFAPTRRNVGIKLMEEPWNPNLSKPNSAEFRALAAKVSAAILNVYKNEPGFQTAKVESFRQASVIVDVVLYFNKTMEDPLSVLRNAVTSGSVGGLPVDSSRPLDRSVEKLGCFFDFGYQYGKRPFPRFYNLRKKFTWFEIFVGKYAVKECEKIARNSKSEYFAVEFFVECWHGNSNQVDFNRDGRAPENFCWHRNVGKAFTMMVYRIL